LELSYQEDCGQIIKVRPYKSIIAEKSRLVKGKRSVYGSIEAKYACLGDVL